MALISCPECGKQISDKAAACPHCGAPVSAAGAPEERKCGECGSVLPDGMAFCPSCGCPAENTPVQHAQPAQPVQSVQPVQPVQPVYTAPSVSPAPAASPQLGSVQARIAEEIKNKITVKNVWLFIYSAGAVVLYLIAFFKYMKALNGVLNFSETIGRQLAAGVVDWFSDNNAAAEFISACKTMRNLLIGALVVMGITFIFDIVLIYQKKVMSWWLLGIWALEIAGFWIPMGVMSNLTGFNNDRITKTLDLVTNDDFGTYIRFASIMIIVLYAVSVVVFLGTPEETDFCPNCGRNIKHDGAGGVCGGCGQRKYIPGFVPVPRGIVDAYPYSGETLIGKSRFDKGRLFLVILIDMIMGPGPVALLVWGIGYKDLLAIIFAFAVLIGLTIFTVVNVANGLKTKITVTPTSVAIIYAIKRRRFKASISEITDVLTNPVGDIAICARGKAFIFKDIKGKEQIAAALTTLTSK